jgi:DHA1 family bicyclomycin/chloramphenicol resistance-like MFS transporter
MKALHYAMRIGETHPANRRAPLAVSVVASSYGRLAVDPLFFFPAASVSLVIGGLYTFFAAAPAILMIRCLRSQDSKRLFLPHLFSNWRPAT